MGLKAVLLLNSCCGCCTCSCCCSWLACIAAGPLGIRVFSSSSSAGLFFEFAGDTDVFVGVDDFTPLPLVIGIVGLSFSFFALALGDGLVSVFTLGLFDLSFSLVSLSFSSMYALTFASVSSSAFKSSIKTPELSQPGQTKSLSTRALVIQSEQYTRPQHGVFIGSTKSLLSMEHSRPRS